MRNGKPTALRRAANAVALKAIWLDIDCNKEPPKGYRCKEDGLKALREFCDATRIPYPNAIIDSGNGLHVYWISDKPLSVKEWLGYAEGLDALATQHGLFHDSITTDAARVLRVPGTSNNKQVPPKPVEILLLEADLSFASALSHLLKPNAEDHPRRPAVLRSIHFLTSSSRTNTTSLRFLLSRYKKVARSLLMHMKPMVRSTPSRCGT